MLKAAVSGSFHRHMSEIYEAVGQLRARNVSVLSPADPRIVDNAGEFLFVASDRLRSIRLVQDRHLEAIVASDFLWVVCPDGYTGPSTCMEIGAAHAAKVPVFASSPALDITIGEYVTRVSGYAAAIDLVRQRAPRAKPRMVLLNPEYVVDESVDRLTEFRRVVTGQIGDRRYDPEQHYDSLRRHFAAAYGLRQP